MRRLTPQQWTIDRRFRIAREWSNEELRKIGPHCSGAVVNVSGWQDRDKQGGEYRDYFPRATSYHVTNYSTHSGATGTRDEIELDLASPTLPEGMGRAFDVVFNHTVLEHVFEVRVAFRNLCELARDAVILVVPFAQKQHENPHYRDYWRFTPTCIRTLFDENGLQTVYESESPYADSAVYLFVVASRDPQRWRAVLPSSPSLSNAGAWIGSHRGLLASRIGRGLTRRIARLLGSSSSEDGDVDGP